MTNLDDLDVDSLSIGGVSQTATPSEVNNVAHKETPQNLVADGAITVKSGVVKIAKTVAGVVAATLANPTAGDDDYKKLLIISNQAEANTVTVTGGLGNGGSGEDVITFSGVVGDCVELTAYGGYWYITGGHQYSVA